MTATEAPTAAAAGIDHQYTGASQFFVGGGVAPFDCNDDGRPDLFFAGGSGPAALYRNESPTGGALRSTLRRRYQVRSIWERPNADGLRQRHRLRDLLRLGMVGSANKRLPHEGGARR